MLYPVSCGNGTRSRGTGLCTNLGRGGWVVMLCAVCVDAFRIALLQCNAEGNAEGRRVKGGHRGRRGEGWGREKGCRVGFDGLTACGSEI